MKVLSLCLCFLIPLIFISGCGKKEESQPAPSVESVASDATGEPTRQEDPRAALTDGLLATLQLAADRAVATLNDPGSFSENEAIRIQLPPSFEPAESALQKIGQEQLLDSFTDSMNEAARKSVTAAPEIFQQAIAEMTVQDARSIWNGGDDAATRYLENTTRSLVAERMRPIIAEQTEASGSTRYFKQITEQLSPGKDSLMGNLASLSGVGVPEDFDLDAYVTEKALDGLYTRLAEEEAKIRANPAARSTELVKSAFDLLRKKP
ncbi:MAG: DUF4197 family protein [Verrucomicrobia bacterium]|jgi:hypothetical protein|nr:DUF4197 family protein [Verrucomicrobiota bacterium]